MVIKIKNKDRIITDGASGVSKIVGKLVKVVITAKTQAEIQLYSDDGELIFNGVGFEGKSIIYPINIETNSDYFYITGSIIIIVKGLEEGNAIENIKFVYEE